jgi:hypothetical protein
VLACKFLHDLWLRKGRRKHGVKTWFDLKNLIYGSGASFGDLP